MRTMRRAGIALGCALALLAAGLWLVGRESTLVWAVEQGVGRSDGRLQAAGIAGSLLGSIRMQRLAWRDRGLRFSAQQVSVEWAPSRLLLGRLAIPRLHAAALTIELPPPAGGPTRLPTDLTPPLPFRIYEARVERLILVQGGVRRELADFAIELAADREGWLVALHPLRTGWGEARARARVDAHPPFAVEGSFDLAQDAEPRYSVHATLSGDLRRAALNAEAHGGGGRAEAQAVFAPEAANPLASLTATATGVNPRAWNAQAPVADLSLALRAAGEGETLIRGKLTIANADPGTLDRERLPLSRLSADFDGLGAAWNVTDVRVELGKGGVLEGAGAVKEGTLSVDLATKGLSLDGLQSRLHASRLAGQVNLASDGAAHRVQFALADQRYRFGLDAALKDGTVSVAQALAEAGGSRLRANGSFALGGPRAFKVNGQLTAFDPARFGTYPPARVNSRFSATGELAPVVQVGADLKVSNSRLFGLPAAIDGRVRSRGVDRPEVTLSVSAKIGGTRAEAKGVLEDPANLRVLDLELKLQGQDMAELYPIVGVPIPPTPAYRLAGRLVHREATWEFRKFSGAVGNSDLGGDFLIDRSAKPQFMRADLVSRNLDLRDLAGFIGAETPGRSKPPARANRVLPDDPFSVEKLHAADADIRFAGRRIVTSKLPLADMSTHLRVQDGRLTLEPLSFGVADGEIVSRIALDSRRQPIATTADIQVKRLNLDKLVPGFKMTQASVGDIDGRARLTTQGNSLAAMLGSASGDLALVMNGGAISDLLLRLANLDIANALAVLLRGDKNIPIRCLVADFAAQDGVMRPRTLVLDTGHTRITGQGAIDFADETLDLSIAAKPKGNSLMALRGPILVRGSFANPKVGPDMKNLAARGGIALVLGAVAAPVAGLLPFVELGKREDEDCAPLLAQARGFIDSGANPASVAAKRGSSE